MDLEFAKFDDFARNISMLTNFWKMFRSWKKFPKKVQNRNIFYVKFGL